MVETTTSQAAKMVLRLSTTHRWAVSGTPIQRGLEDLHGLVLFLGLHPFSKKNVWLNCIERPFLETLGEDGNRKLDLLPHSRDGRKYLYDILRNIARRTEKQDVIEELGIPKL